MVADLTGAFAKLDRAEQHLRDLDAALAWWRKQEPCSFVGQHNAAMTEHRFHVSIKVEPDLIRWGVIAGDCVHNLRSALDHVAWQAALVHGQPPDRTEFPIFIDKARYLLTESDRRGGLNKIAGIKEGRIRALIQDAQPWSRRPEDPNNEHLAVLHNLNRKDKHRVLTPVLLVPREIATRGVIEFADEQAAVDAGGPILHVNDGPIEDGAELLAIYTAVPAKKVQMEGNFALGIGIEYPEGTVAGGITGSLGELCKHTRGVVATLGDALT